MSETGQDSNSIQLSHKSVTQFALGSLAAGLLPSFVPGGVALDFAGVAAIQLTMIKKLADGYGIPFRQDAVKSVLVSLLGALAAAKLGYGGIGASLAALTYSVPLLGTAVKWSMAPGFNYLSTVAVGRVFEKHFSEGGTFLDFNIDEMKKLAVKEYDEAKAALFATKSKTIDKLKQENAALVAQLAALQPEKVPVA